MNTRHAAIAAFGLDSHRVRVVAVVAEAAAWRRILDEQLPARSAHAAVLAALVLLAGRRSDASAIDVFVCQQSVPQACSGDAGDEVRRAGLTPRWWPKSRAAEVPALARALHLVAGGAA